MPSHDWQHSSMSSKAVLAANLKALMDHSPAYSSQVAVAKAARCDQKTVSRLLRQEQAATVDLLDAIAAVFGLESWQLLTENLDPSNPPKVHMTKSEQALYERLRTAAKALVNSAGEQ